MSNIWLCDVSSASIAGILGTIIGHPFDTIKCRLQVCHLEYSSFSQCLVKIIKEEKIGGLFKGIVSPLINQLPINAICNRYLTTLWNHKHKQATYFLSGAYSGFLTVFFTVPMEIIKCIQQYDSKNNVSVKEACKIIYNKFGYFGFMRGYWVTFHRDVWGYAFYFYFYYVLKEFGERKKINNTAYMLFIGGFAGTMSWLYVYPFDTLKTIIQSDLNKSGKDIKQYYLIKKLVSEQGIRSIFRGIETTLVRGFMVNAIVFYSNEIAHKYLDVYFL